MLRMIPFLVLALLLAGCGTTGSAGSAQSTAAAAVTSVSGQAQSLAPTAQALATSAAPTVQAGIATAQTGAGTVIAQAQAVATTGPDGGSCPFASQADASAALGKPTLEGEREGDDKCFFAAADTTTPPATEYVDVAVTRHDSADDARIFMEAAAGRSDTKPVTGLGESAVFTREEEGGTLVVLKGNTTVLVAVTGKSQADPESALRQLATAVLTKV